MAVKPSIHVIGAGGTIAGVGSSATSAAYTSGNINAPELLAAVDGLDRVANISAETMFSSGSEDLGPCQWLELARRVRAAVEIPDIEGVVITHGTDTLEEAAFFLDLVTRTEKAVVITAAMRPSTALSADGPANIYQAVLAAADRRLRNRGVMVAMNGLVLPGWQAIKTNSVALDSFRAYPGGPVGRVLGDRLVALPADRPGPLAGVFERIRERDAVIDVGVVYVQAGCGADTLRVREGDRPKGLVIAAFGAGTMPEPLAAAACRMASKGCAVVVSSRACETMVQPATMTVRPEAGLLASGVLNPAKSAILLSLALTEGLPLGAIGQLFDLAAAGVTGPIVADAAI